jgi:hypothetical protein
MTPWHNARGPKNRADFDHSFFTFVSALVDAYAWKAAAVAAAEPVHPEKPVEAPAAAIV